MEQGMQQGMEQGMQQGLEQGLEQGMQRGQEQAAAAIVRNMLKMQVLTVAQLAAAAEVSEEFVRDIQNAQSNE